MKKLHEEMLTSAEAPILDGLRADYENATLMSERALHLCHAIERSPASEQLTKCSLLAAQLRKELERYEETRPMTARENALINAAWKLYGPSNTQSETRRDER